MARRHESGSAEFASLTLTRLRTPGSTHRGARARPGRARVSEANSALPDSCRAHDRSTAIRVSLTMKRRRCAEREPPAPGPPARPSAREVEAFLAERFGRGV